MTEQKDRVKAELIAKIQQETKPEIRAILEKKLKDLDKAVRK